MNKRILPSLISMLVLGWMAVCSLPAEASHNYFKTLLPGTALPSGSTCASRVRRSNWEPRPQNYKANHKLVSTTVHIDGASASFNATFASRINGRFTGTTDEIIQWASCKWGIDEDVTRARAVQESHWKQSQLGDRTTSKAACATIGKSTPCWQSHGLLQVKGTVHEGTYPYSQQSTAFNADYSLAWLRACYSGAFSQWMPSSYRSGDLWGCVGTWYSGRWYDDDAKWYIGKVKVILSQKPWKQPGF